MDGNRPEPFVLAIDPDARRNLALDGLRACAVLLVLLDHTSALQYPPQSSVSAFTGFTAAPHGVRIFFVLSGFLITSILIGVRDRTDAFGTSKWLAWRAFAVRRALRIFPTAYLAMTYAWVIGVPTISAHPWLYATYLHNALPILRMPDGLALSHFWTLAVEEHFYVIWPFFVLFAPRRWLKPATVAVLIAGCSARILTASIWNPFVAYEATWSRFDSLAFGGLLAITQPRLTSVALAGLLVAALSATTSAGSPTWIGVHESGLVIATGWLVLAVARGYGHRLLSIKPLVFLGTISYGVYVWHVLLQPAAAGLHWLPEPGWWKLLFVLAITVPFAALSWDIFERPLNGLKRHFPYVPHVSRPLDIDASLESTADKPMSQATLSPVP